MKVLCPACERMVELERFRLEGAALLVTCGKCGVETRVAPTGTAPTPSSTMAQPFREAPLTLVSQPGASNVVTVRSAASDAVASAQATQQPFAVPDGVCPKCISPRSPGPACSSCGLVFAQLGPHGVEVPTWLQTLWVDLLRDWGSEAKHDQTRRFASQRGALAELGRLYRLALVRTPNDPFAENGRAEIVRMAAMAVSLRPAIDVAAAAGPSRVKVALTAVLLVVTLVTMGYLLTLLLKPPTG